jgi:hypothetical protein
VHGALTSTLLVPGDGDSDSGTDSDEDIDRDDLHRLRQISQAVRRGQPSLMFQIGVTATRQQNGFKPSLKRQPRRIRLPFHLPSRSKT